MLWLSTMKSLQIAVSFNLLLQSLFFLVSNRLNSVSECLSPAEYYASPILNALIKRRHGSHSNLTRQFRSVTTTANVSLDTESSAQSPVKQGSMDFLDVGIVGAPRRL